MGLLIKTRFDSWSLGSAAIGIFIVIPIITIFIQLFNGPGENWSHFTETLFQRYLVNSLILVFGIGVSTLIIGVLCAWLVASYDFPGRSFFEWSLMLPLSIPTYISAITYAGIFDFRGPFYQILAYFLGTKAAQFVPDILNINGVLFVISMVLYPYVYVVSKSAFLSQSQTIIENSRLLGSTSSRIFFKVALPMAHPFILGGLVLVIMEVLNDYGAVKYYGVQNFTTGIFKAWFSMGDLQGAIYLSALLMFFVFAILGLEKWQRRKINYEEPAKSLRPLRRIKMKKTQAFLSSAFCLLILSLGFLLPVGQLIYWAIGSADLISGDFFKMASNSFLLAGAGSIVCVFTSVLVIYSKRIHARSVLLKMISQIAVLGYSIPGAVIAVGILIPLIAFDKQLIKAIYWLFGLEVGLLLSGTVAALVFAYLIRYLVVAFNPIEAGFNKACSNLEEASQTLGVGKLKTLLKVDLPLVKGAIMSAAILVFIDILKELPLTLILRPFNFDTLATQAFQYASDEMISYASWPALVIIATGLIPVILINKLMKNNA